MSLLIYLYIALSFSMVIAISMAIFYWVPAIKKKSLGEALTLLLWPHVFRYVSLSSYAAAEFGSIKASSSELNQIIIGDTLSGVLAFLAILVIRYRKSWAIPFIWVAVVIGSVDFVLAIGSSLSSGLAGNVSGFSWFLFVFFIPPLVVTEVMLFWQLISRKGEALYTEKQGK